MWDSNGIELPSPPIGRSIKKSVQLATKNAWSKIKELGLPVELEAFRPKDILVCDQLEQGKLSNERTIKISRREALIALEGNLLVGEGKQVAIKDFSTKVFRSLEMESKFWAKIGNIPVDAKYANISLWDNRFKGL